MSHCPLVLHLKKMRFCWSLEFERDQGDQRVKYWE